jgi:hypothetical protein
MSIINFNTAFDGIFLPNRLQTVCLQAIGGTGIGTTVGTAVGNFGAGNIITNISLFGTSAFSGAVTFSIYATNTASTGSSQPIYLSLQGTYPVGGSGLCQPLDQDCWLQLYPNVTGSSYAIPDPLNVVVTYLSSQ